MLPWMTAEPDEINAVFGGDPWLLRRRAESRLDAERAGALSRRAGRDRQGARVQGHRQISRSAGARGSGTGHPTGDEVGDRAWRCWRASRHSIDELDRATSHPAAAVGRRPPQRHGVRRPLLARAHRGTRRRASVASLFNGELLFHGMRYTISEALGRLRDRRRAGGAAAVRACGAIPVIAAILDPFMVGGYGAPKLALRRCSSSGSASASRSKIALVASVVFFIVYFNALSGVRALDPRLVQMAQIAGASERQVGAPHRASRARCRTSSPAFASRCPTRSAAP